ncbi:hypothetical protein ACJX0J_036832, partial [Zea mays]
NINNLKLIYLFFRIIQMNFNPMYSSSILQYFLLMFIIFSLHDSIFFFTSFKNKIFLLSILDLLD